MRERVDVDVEWRATRLWWTLYLLCERVARVEVGGCATMTTDVLSMCNMDRCIDEQDACRINFYHRAAPAVTCVINTALATDTHIYTLSVYLAYSIRMSYIPHPIPNGYEPAARPNPALVRSVCHLHILSGPRVP
jgi:hypothetical protein